MLGKSERELQSEKPSLPSAQNMLKQATLKLGGPTGEAVRIEDIRFYLGAKFLVQLESGDRNSENFRLLQNAQNLSSPIGVLSAINIFNTQLNSLREELSKTPKGKRDRDLVREGVALGLSRIKLEKEILPTLQRPTDKQASIFEKTPADHQEEARDHLLKPNLLNYTQKEIEATQAALRVWLQQPVDKRITSVELKALLNGVMLRRYDLFVAVNLGELLIKAESFSTSKEGRDAAIRLVEFDGEQLIEMLKEQKLANIDETILRIRHVVAGVKELIGELEKGDKKS